MSTSDRYALWIEPGAKRSLTGMPVRHSTAILEFVERAIRVNPWRVGKPLERELEGYLAARIEQYRVVYRVLEESHVVRVVRVERRSDVYRPR